MTILKALKASIGSKILIAVFILLAGCEYEAPLTTDHSVAIDPAVLGVWVPDDGEAPKLDERLMILKYSDTEYLIHYPPSGNDETYYRGYPIKIGSMSCVQVQVIGTEVGPPEQDSKKLFYVLWYQLTDGQLEIRKLNTDLVDDDLKTTDELRKVFLKNSKNKDLFTDPGVFRKMKK